MTAQAASTAQIAWQPWTETLFTQAQREHKLVILDLEATWCHWCHVMDEQTYANPHIAAELASHYIAVKVDHDARPDLAERYRDYGWPATIIFDAKGRELVKRAGYIPVAEMQQLLAAVVKDPTPEASVATDEPSHYADSPLLDSATRNVLLKRFVSTHDQQLGGLNTEQKYLDLDTAEYAMLMAQKGDKTAAQIGRQDLTAALALLDPVWGGAYQYSINSDWQHPHYEKLATVQADYLRIYALAYSEFHDPAYLHATQNIVGYVQHFMLSPEGAFYTSQDADLIPGQQASAYFRLNDAGRRALGIPRIDQHIYSRTNGLMITALATLYGATSDSAYLTMAVRATNWILANRALTDGGFRHAGNDPGGPYLGDNLAMGRAFVALYSVTGNRNWLNHAEQTGQFIAAHFQVEGKPGFVTAQQNGPLKPVTLIDENMPAVRFFNQLYYYSGKQQYRSWAEYAMKYLATPQIALSRITEAGILEAALELANSPTHLTIVGHKDDPQALLLFKAALAYPAIYRRVEWWDKREGAMPNPDVQYPEMPRAAGFVCGDGRCSSPVYDPASLGKLADRLSGVKPKTSELGSI